MTRTEIGCAVAAVAFVLAANLAFFSGVVWVVVSTLRALGVDL